MLKRFLTSQFVLLILSFSGNSSDVDPFPQGNDASIWTIASATTHPELAPVYQAISQQEPRSSRQIIRHPEAPKPPHLVALSTKVTEELVKLAKGGDALKLKELVKRIYWSASENPRPIPFGFAGPLPKLGT